jgi:hypothetical protein
VSAIAWLPLSIPPHPLEGEAVVHLLYHGPPSTSIDAVDRLEPLHLSHSYAGRNPSVPYEFDIGNSRNSTDRSDVDSIWNVDFQESWEQRRLEDEAAAEELKTNAPVLLGAGFSVSPGQSMSRRSSRQGSKKSNPNTARSSRVSSTNNLSLAAQPLPPDLQQHRSFIGAMNHTRRQLRSLMRLKRFHLIMIALVGFDLMIVMVEAGLLLSV